MSSTHSSIVIPTYNGKRLLARYLPSVIEAVRCDANRHEIIVVEDGGSDDTIEWLSSCYPTVRAYKLKENQGFPGACNCGAAQSVYDLLIFLNNDMQVEPDFISPLLRHFQNEKVFAVVAKSLVLRKVVGEERTISHRNESVVFGHFARGTLKLEYPAFDAQADNYDQVRPMFYAFGGGFACRKQKFMSLGGFDDLYAPYTVEDIDLSYRAWKRGWVILYEPRSVMYHQHGATLSGIGTIRQRQMIVRRNFFLLLWRNITSKQLMRKHLLWLVLRVISNLASGHLMYHVSLFCALRRIRQVARRRSKEIQEQVWSDDEVLERSRRPW